MIYFILKYFSVTVKNSKFLNMFCSREATNTKSVITSVQRLARDWRIQDIANSTSMKERRHHRRSFELLLHVRVQHARVHTLQSVDGWLRRVCPSLSGPFSTWYRGIDSLRCRLDVSTLLCGSCKFFRSSSLWWIGSIIMEFWNNLWSYDWWLVLI